MKLSNNANGIIGQYVLNLTSMAKFVYSIIRDPMGAFERSPRIKNHIISWKQITKIIHYELLKLIFNFFAEITYSLMFMY